MLDETLKIEKKESSDFKPLPKNIYQVELFDINAEQRPTYETKNKPDEEKIYETVMNFQFVLLGGFEGTESLRGRFVWANFIPTYFYVSTKSGENKTLKIVKAIMRRDLTQQEEAEGLSGKFLNSLVGKQLRVSVDQKINGEKTYNNITDFFSIENEMTPLSSDEKSKLKKSEKMSNEDAEQFVIDSFNDINIDIPND